MGLLVQHKNIKNSRSGSDTVITYIARMRVHPGLGSTFVSAGARRITVASPASRPQAAALLPETFRFGTLEMFAVLVKSMRNREDESEGGFITSIGGQDIWRKGKKAIALSLLEGDSARAKGEA